MLYKRLAYIVVSAVSTKKINCAFAYISIMYLDYHRIGTRTPLPIDVVTEMTITRIVHRRVALASSMNDSRGFRRVDVDTLRIAGNCFIGIRIQIKQDTYVSSFHYFM